LQAAWDAGDVEELRRYTTAEMLDELLQELPIRGPGENRTDVVTLDAALLALEQIGSRHVASIEFSGMIRESSEQGAAPFKELWLLTRHTEDHSGWRLARHQALM
jgi:predicted lipid-binding transport protein (Tim44 family)